MSLTALAEQLDLLAAQADAHITEGEAYVTVSNLRARATLRILETCAQLDWKCSVYDEEQTPTEQSNIIEDFAPFRITIAKPERTEKTLDILTSAGFLQWLDKGSDAIHWRIAGLSKPLFTQARTYTDWTSTETVTISPETKSPRALVKESGSSQIVPRDIRPWLLLDQSQLDFDDFHHKSWCIKAFDALVLTLPNEIDPQSHSLIFKGPPKLVLHSPQASTATIQEFGNEAFLYLQSAASWAYENNREAEVKHSLLAMEIARSGRENGSAATYLKANLSTALESAKIAYQMSLSELGKDTLKSLGDLRKAITEETAKATDATRQIITAVSGALAVGIGLVAARLGTDINPWLVSIVMLIAAGYIGMVVYSGWSFLSLQRELRRDWQPKLYRFLPAEDYKKMVTVPAEKSERVFKYSAAVGTAAVITMCVGVSIFSFVSEPKANDLKPDQSELKTVIPAQLNKQLQKPGFSLPDRFHSSETWFSPLARPSELSDAPGKP